MEHQGLSIAHESRILSTAPCSSQPWPWGQHINVPSKSLGPGLGRTSLWIKAQVSDQESGTITEMESQGRHETRARIWDGGTEAKPGEIPGEQLQVLYYICCVFSHQMGRSAQLEGKPSRPGVGGVSVAALHLDHIGGWVSHARLREDNLQCPGHCTQLRDKQAMTMAYGICTGKRGSGHSGNTLEPAQNPGSPYEFPVS